MRSIAAALTTAQKSASAEPYISAIVETRIGQAARLDFALLDATANTIARHDACVAGDGSPIRVRMDAGNVKYQRITTPHTGPYNGAWTTLTAGMGLHCAIAAFSTAA